MRSLVNPAPLWFASAALALAAFVACQPGVKLEQEGLFAIDNHSLLPPEKAEGEVWRTSVGVTPQPVDPQPIAFNHKIHASTIEEGGLGMYCQYCHSNARQSKHGGVPSSQVCMGCHNLVPVEGRSEEAVKALTQVKDYWAKGEPIPWVKVHDLPDFVYYDHSAHLNARNEKGEWKIPRADAGGKAIPPCQECHGKVETMDIVSVQNPFNMQWCLDCHRQPEMKASTDCVTCHR